jgi:hypothetical protein
MASSVVEIVNNALVEIGEPNLITSLSDNTRAAILSNQKYPAVRDATLRAYPWNCAIGRQTLSPLGDTPNHEWTHQFQLPATCLRVLGLELRADEFDVEGRRIMANTNEIKIKFIQRVEDVTVYDALLAEALSSRLAHALAYAITQSASMREAMWENYRAKLREARSIDAQEGSPKSLEASEWIEGRFGAGSVRDLRNPA